VKGSKAAVALLALAFVVPLLVIVMVVGGSAPPCDQQGAGGSGGGPGTGALAAGGIPVAFVPLIQKAGALDAAFPAPVLAAQIQQESGFRASAVSSTGAMGYSQFEPQTWGSYGKDTTGKGSADPNNFSDAVDAQSRYDHDLANQVRAAQAAGKIHSTASVTEMALGGYNAGIGAVLAAGGVPGNAQTSAYVPAIMNMARGKFSEASTTAAAAPGAPAPGAAPAAPAAGAGVSASGGCGSPGQVQVLAPTVGGAVGGAVGGPTQQRVVDAAKTQRGLPYIWGGGGTNGPTGGGFDCSGLTQYAFAKVGVALPRVAQDATSLTTAFAAQLFDAGQLVATASPGRRLATPLLFILDEAANVCRIRQLPDLYSHFGSRGMPVLTILQGWSQGVQCWERGGHAETVVRRQHQVLRRRCQRSQLSARPVHHDRRPRRGEVVAQQRPRRLLTLAVLVPGGDPVRRRAAVPAPRPRGAVVLGQPRGTAADSAVDGRSARRGDHQVPGRCRCGHRQRCGVVVSTGVTDSQEWL